MYRLYFTFLALGSVAILSPLAKVTATNEREAHHRRHNAWGSSTHSHIVAFLSHKICHILISSPVWPSRNLFPLVFFCQAFSPSFFLGTEAGGVCYADDLGHCSEVQQLTSAVDSLLFYEAARRLVVITRSLLMTQLQVCPSWQRRTVQIFRFIHCPKVVKNVVICYQDTF